MLFNSLQFLLFFGVVTLAYFLLSWRGRWVLLLAASCYFYMVFKPEYVLILAVTIVVDYVAGIWIEQAQGLRRKVILIISLISNVGFLAYFKYFNFFAQNFNKLLPQAQQLDLLDILLPIGLSFHTFQAMSYTIEVYRGNQTAERHFGIYALYVMFYPQLVAGPIERPQNLLPQFHAYFQFSRSAFQEGVLRMAWGFFKKVVIADRLGLVVDAAYDHPDASNGLSLLVATFFFTFQIYCDFSGYSDIAIGAARCMGFKLMDNFNAPYQSKSISEFWRRWHISLSTWFRDYLYIPLGGNRASFWRANANLLIVFMASGLWHGAKWTFVIWGSLHGLYLVAARLRDQWLPQFKQHWTTPPALQVISTFGLVMFTWVFFRASGTAHAIAILKQMTALQISDPLLSPLNGAEMAFCVLLIVVLLAKDRWLPVLRTTSQMGFWLMLVCLAAASYFGGVFNSNQFIYFQF
jgi:alginate O-acetyltransferase complex protein AlgI